MSIKQFKDSRGTFMPYDVNGWDQVNIVTNENAYTFRGLHWQTNPAQIKCVKVIQGSVIDILYNLKTLKVEFYNLDSSSDPLTVGEDYAHGYLTLEPNTIFTYLVKGEYSPSTEHSLVWNKVKEIKDMVNIIIGNKKLIISDKDKLGK